MQVKVILFLVLDCLELQQEDCGGDEEKCKAHDNDNSIVEEHQKFHCVLAQAKLASWRTSQRCPGRWVHRRGVWWWEQTEWCHERSHHPTKLQPGHSMQFCSQAWCSEEVCKQQCNGHGPWPRAGKLLLLPGSQETKVGSCRHCRRWSWDLRKSQPAFWVGSQNSSRCPWMPD